MVAACDTRTIARWVNAAGIGVRYENSFSPRATRLNCTPQSCGPGAGYRSDLNGMANSTIQPWSNRRARASHTVFQSRFESRSSVIRLSLRPPSGVDWNCTPLRRSWKVSNSTAKLSFWKFANESRRISLATIRDGSVDQQRAVT